MKDVEGSKSELSIADCKDLIFYGCTRDKSFIVDNNKESLDWAYWCMIGYLKKETVFDGDKVESLFWERIQKIANQMNATK